MIKFDNVSKRYTSGHEGLSNVSFSMDAGEMAFLTGHSGAGKSTLLKMLNSLNRPDSGRITMMGRVSALIELGAGFNPVLTGRENIYNQAALHGFSKKETDARFESIVDFSELEGFLDTWGPSLKQIHF